MKNKFKEYRIELIAILIVLLGIFLLVEQYNIRAELIRITMDIGNWAKETGKNLATTAKTYLLNFTLSDLTGWVLIISASIFITWRIRYRFTNSERWRADKCPRCDSSLHRVHRSRLDRFLTYAFLPHAHRYLCANEACGWTGLRRRRHLVRRKADDEEFEQ